MYRLFLAVLLLALPARAETLRILAAGSLTEAFSDLARRFPAGADSVAPPQFGPSGLLREKIEAGAPADLFASADMTQPRRIAAGRPVIHYTRNRLCAFARPATGVTTANVLDRMLDPAIRVATSTPGADPGGDYAFAVFARAEALHPGARAVLEAKALKLVGGGDKTPLLVPGKGAVEGVFLANAADIMLAYCSGAESLRRTLPDLTSAPLPPGLAVGPEYGMVVLNPSPVALRFVAYVMSEAGQTILKAHGFDPVALAAPAPGVLVGKRPFDPAALAALPAITQHAKIGRTDADWTGPALWSLLVAAGAVDPAKHGEFPHRLVRVTGADGYEAVFGLAEIAPDFANRPILLALSPNALPHLVVPGEARGGRSVRDVVRIAVE